MHADDDLPDAHDADNIKPKADGVYGYSPLLIAKGADSASHYKFYRHIKLHIRTVGCAPVDVTVLKAGGGEVAYRLEPGGVPLSDRLLIKEVMLINGRHLVKVGTRGMSSA